MMRRVSGYSYRLVSACISTYGDRRRPRLKPVEHEARARRATQRRLAASAVAWPGGGHRAAVLAVATAPVAAGGPPPATGRPGIAERFGCERRQGGERKQQGKAHRGATAQPTIYAIRTQHPLVPESTTGDSLPAMCKFYCFGRRKPFGM